MSGLPDAAMMFVRFSGKAFVTGEGEQYNHAVIVRRYHEEDQKYAFNYQPSEQDRLDYEWLCHVARQIPGSIVFGTDNVPSTEFTHEKIASAKAKVADGWEGYVKARQAEEERRFKLKVLTGYYDPFVFAWTNSEEEAEQAFAEAEAQGFEPLCIKEISRD